MTKLAHERLSGREYTKRYANDKQKAGGPLNFALRKRAEAVQVKQPPPQPSAHAVKRAWIKDLGYKLGVERWLKWLRRRSPAAVRAAAGGKVKPTHKQRRAGRLAAKLYQEGWTK